MGALFVAAVVPRADRAARVQWPAPTSALALARGARLRSVRLSLIVESLLLTLPAAALALGVAWLVEPAANWAVSLGAAALVRDRHDRPW
jgi:hypothetical protein